MLFPQLTTVRVPVDTMVSWGIRQLAAELTALSRGEEPAVQKVVLDHVVAYHDSEAPPDQVEAAHNCSALG